MVLGIGNEYDKNRVEWGTYASVGLWSLFWILNCLFTVEGVKALGVLLQNSPYEFMVTIGVLLSNVLVAVGLHCVISLIEGLVWYKGGNVTLWGTFLLVLFIDVGTTSFGLAAIRDSMGIGIDNFWVVIMAIAFALLPEIAAINHIKAAGSPHTYSQSYNKKKVEV